MRRVLSVVLTLGGVLLGWAACGSDPVAPGEVAVLSSVAPVGGATNVDINTTISVGFSHAMQAGMEQYMVVHEGDLSGPLVPGTWTWSDGGTICEFTPDGPFGHQMQYMLHVGGGVKDVHGHHVDFTDGVTHMGGHMIHDTMMHGSMMGRSMMGEGWMHPDGTYGVGFPFTTF
jgi:hypothetical protein